MISVMMMRDHKEVEGHVAAARGRVEVGDRHETLLTSGFHPCCQARP